MHYPAETPSERQHQLEAKYWLWGQIGEASVEAPLHCAEGQLYEAHVFSSLEQGLLSVATFGIYTPRTIQITCSGRAPQLEEAPEEAPLPQFVPRSVPADRPFEEH
jgi:hypothetical protein